MIATSKGPACIQLGIAVFPRPDASGLRHAATAHLHLIIMAVQGASAMILAFFALALSADTPHQSVTYKQVVDQADPRLAWLSSSPVPFGTAVGELPLAASAAVPGNFLYTPAAGAILEPGEQTVTVVFMPANPNYRSETATLKVTILPPGNSSFNVALPAALPGDSLVFLSADNEATLKLIIIPVGDFHQPVELGCSSNLNITCRFTPDTARPSTEPMPVTLDMHFYPSSQPSNIPAKTAIGRHRNNRSPQMADTLRAGLIFSLMPLLTTLTLRRRLQVSARLASILSLLALAIPLFGFCLGCAQFRNTASLTVNANSLRETRSLKLTVVLWH